MNRDRSIATDLSTWLLHDDLGIVSVSEPLHRQALAGPIDGVPDGWGQAGSDAMHFCIHESGNLFDNDLACDPMITRTRNLMRSALVGILALSYSLLAHLSTAQGGHGTLGALLAIGPVGLIALVVAWRSAQRVLGLTACLLAAALIATQWHELKAHFVWVYLIQQVGVYSLLGLSFGRTLALDRVPLCTQMALRVHGTLPAEALRYTRQVTIAWTLFFAVTTATLIFLFLAAPLTIWSAFANFGIPVLVIIMFVIENRVRRRVLPDMTHAGVITTIRASAVDGFGAVERRS